MSSVAKLEEFKRLVNKKSVCDKSVLISSFFNDAGINYTYI